MACPMKNPEYITPIAKKRMTGLSNFNIGIDVYNANRAMTPGFRSRGSTLALKRVPKIILPEPISCAT
jgi:hypothetical protein